MISEAERRLYQELRSKGEKSDLERPPAILADLTDVAARNKEWLRVYLLLRFGEFDDSQHNAAKIIGEMDLDLQMYRGRDAHGVLSNEINQDELERDGYGELRVFSLRSVLTRLNQICNEVEADFKAVQNQAIPISKEAYKRYRRFKQINQRLQGEIALIDEVGIDPYEHAKKWLANANGAADYAAKDAQSVRKMAMAEGTESIVYRNLGLRHLKTVDPVINNEKYASMLSKLETSFLQFAGLDAGSCPAVLHGNMEEIAKFCLNDAFVFYVGEDDTDLSFAPVVCYLISHKYRADILKKNIKSSSISLHAIFGGYHMAHDAMTSASRDFSFYMNLRTTFSEYYGAAATDSVKALWDNTFLRCSRYLDRSYRFLMDVLREQSFSESDAFFMLRRIHQSAKSNVSANLAHTTHAKINELTALFFTIDDCAPWQTSMSLIRELLSAGSEEKYNNTITAYLEMVSKPHTGQDIVDFLNGITNPTTSAQIAQKKFLYLELDRIFPEVFIPQDGTVNLLCSALVNAAVEYTIRTELAERCEEKLFSWASIYLSMKHGDS
ncbi:MAG: hypothetical protein IKN81_06425 [Oscillospiraceae bacterium]|nr:hypothetical protein [Oscillospiraceae bacterium]